MGTNVDKMGRTELHYACAERRVADVARLLDTGSDPNAQDRGGWTPLHFAAQSVSAEIATLLLARGADVSSRDAHGNTPLGRAVFDSKGDGTVIRVLLTAGADRHAKNASGVSPLDLANRIGNYDVKQFFADGCASRPLWTRVSGHCDHGIRPS